MLCLICVGAGIHYPIPIHELGAYKEEMKPFAGKLPEVSAYAPKILSLRMFPELTETQAQRVIDLCKQFFASGHWVSPHRDTQQLAAIRVCILHDAWGLILMLLWCVELGTL